MYTSTLITKKENQMKEKNKITYCEICKEQTGFGFGKEPMRYDTGCCSSKCWTKWNTKCRSK